MRKILLQLDSDPQPSVFDAITALDSSECSLLRHGGVTAESAVPLVHGCMFTRPPKELRSTAIFIGGSNVDEAGKILDKVKETMWPPLDVSLMFDPNVCNTPAAAAVHYMASSCDMSGKKVVVLSGTGPVGQRSAGIFQKLGASVVITSRNIDKAKSAASSIGSRFGEAPECAVVKNEDDVPPVIDGAVSVLCCGAAGIRLLSEKLWREHRTLKVVADVNAVPPLGVEGTEAVWRAHEVDGKIVYGALGIGWLKMRIHHLAVSRLFETKGLVLDTEGIYELAREAAA